MMKTAIASVTRRGQVTIPAAMLRQLAIPVPGKIQFVVTDRGEVEIRPIQHTVQSLRGIVPRLSGQSEDDFEAMIEDAKDEAVARHASAVRPA